MLFYIRNTDEFFLLKSMGCVDYHGIVPQRCEVNMFYGYVVGGILFMACGESQPQKSKKEGQPNAEKPSPKITPLPKSQAKAEISGVFDPVKGKKRKEICSADGLLLIQWPYSKIQAEFTDLCCGAEGLSSDDYRCEMDWPFSDVPSCSAYDDMKNEIFARYGRAFSTPKWQKHFGATDWYQIREDFSNDWISDVAQKNIALLVQKKKSKVACMD